MARIDQDAAWVNYDSFETDEEAAYINGEDAEGIDELRRYVVDVIGERDYCPYCSIRFAIADSARNLDGGDGRLSTLAVCPRCLHWQWNHNQWSDWGEAGWNGYLSKVRSFDALPAQCQQEIAQWIIRKPSLLHSMSPTLLEKEVAAVFKANFDECEVVHVGRPGDGGVDVLFVESGGIQTLIQVKRRGAEKATEAAETIRNLLGVMTLQGATRGVVVSTVDHFTFQARREAVIASQRGFEIALVDKGRLLRMLPALMPPRPWIQCVRDKSPTLIASFSKQLRQQGVDLDRIAMKMEDFLATASE